MLWTRALVVAVMVALAATVTPIAAEPVTAHAIAIHGEPKYPAGFEHLDYVNPDAPKGGTLRLGGRGTFDSFNPFIAKGTAAPAYGVETLTTQTLDDPNVEYGLIAESIEVPEDRSWVIFTLRPEARWHDGKPITVDDVLWSFDTLKTKGHPRWRFYFGSVANAEKIGDRQVKFTFDQKGNRELPVIVGQLPVMPKHYWESRDFEKTTLEPPLSSGPYRIADFEPGRFIEAARVDDYWGKDLPINVGQNNFERIRTDYFLDETVLREALKAGEIDYFEENIAKVWALDYDTPAVRNGSLIKEAIEHQQPTGMQAFVFNTRREIFKDPKLREALAYAFDFDWTNRNMFFDQYTRTESYFSNTELASSGLPEGEELEVLEQFRGRIPDEVFTTVYKAPSTDGSGWPRDNLRRAFALLEEAGWVVRDQKLVNAETGEPFEFEVLLVSPSFSRIILPFVRNLNRLGIETRVRVVDSSQFVNRVRAFDYDMIVSGWGQSESPGNEQRNYWTSAAADSPAGRNYAGIKNDAIDELVELVITAPTRESLVARTRALDRVLLHGHYVIPNWHLRTDRILHWNKFSRPEVTPRYGTSTSVWWFDEEKAAALESERGRSRGGAIGTSTTAPGGDKILLVTIALLVAGVYVFRRVMRKPET